MLSAPCLPQQQEYICVYRACSGASTDPAFPWHAVPVTLELSQDRISTFKAGSYIYLAPDSCLPIDETKCLTGKKKWNQQSLLFHVVFFVSIYLLFFMACYRRAQEMNITLEQLQIPAFYAIGLLRIKCRPRSGGCLCQET